MKDFGMTVDQWARLSSYQRRALHYYRAREQSILDDHREEMETERQMSEIKRKYHGR